MLGAIFQLATIAQPDLASMFQVVAENPAVAAARSNLGVALKASGRLEEAEAQLLLAVQLDSTYARGYNNLGNAQQALGRHAAAEKNHRVATALQPGMASAHNSLGNALRGLKRPQEAAKAFGVALEMHRGSPYVAAYSNLGAALREFGQLDASIGAHGIATSLAPSDPTVLNNFGAALEAAGRLPEAAAAFDAALRLAPATGLLHVNRGNVLKGTAKLDEAIAAYSAALRLPLADNDRATAYNNLGATLQGRGQMPLAAAAYGTALAIYPGFASAAANLDKLPTSPKYVAAADKEVAGLARRAALGALAAWGARRAGRSLDALGLGGRGGGGAGAELPSATLFRTVRFLRRVESERSDSGGLWDGRAAAIPGAITGAAATHTVTLGAFAWGGVWMASLAATATHPECRAALGRAAREGGGAVVLGSSIGFEVYWAALSYGVRTVGVELLCSLTEFSERVRRAHAVGDGVAQFVCSDALEYALPARTELVYVDDTAWDAASTKLLAQKLARELRPGAVVIHNTAHDYDGGEWRQLEALQIPTSWNDFHPIYVHLRE